MASCQEKLNSKYTGRDVRIFESSPVWEHALAIRDNNFTRLSDLLLSTPKAILNYKEPYYGQTLLNWSVYRESNNAALILINSGADVNIKANDSTSPIINAADIPNNSEILIELVAKGADLNDIANIEEPQRKRTPIIAAAYTDLENVKTLIRLGANPNYIHRTKRGNIGGENIQSALISAFRANRIDIIKYLIIDVGVEYNYHFNTDINGKELFILYYLRDMTFEINTPEYNDKMSVVEFLLDNGLNYWEEPIPNRIKKKYDEDYLKKY